MDGRMDGLTQPGAAVGGRAFLCPREGILWGKATSLRCATLPSCR